MVMTNMIFLQIGQAASVLGITVPPAPHVTADTSAYSAYASALGAAYPTSPITPASHALPLLLFALATELQGLRIALTAQYTAQQSKVAAEVEPGIESELYLLCRALAVPPGSDDTLKAHPERALAQVKAKLDKTLARLPSDFFTASQPLLQAEAATPELMSQLGDFNTICRSDYAMRREMLLARLDLTIQSFLWSRKAEGREGEILSSIAHRRKALTIQPASIRPEDAFSAGPELAALHARRVTDSSSRALRSASVKSVRIGAVPDRGGRVGEMAPSARDLMPAWQARKEGAGGRGSAGAGAGRAGGSAGGGGGGGGGKRYDRGHNDRAVALLQEASKYEGEAGAALEERLEDDRAEAIASGGSGGGHGGDDQDDAMEGGGQGREKGRGGRGGGRHGGRGGRGGGGGSPTVTVTVSGGALPAAGGGGGGGGGQQQWNPSKRGRKG